MENIRVSRALVSVSDKTGLVPFARALAGLGVEIVSTGGTAKTLDEAGVPVVNISDVTGFPEMLEGRVKTLHPNVHGGILADRDKPEHLQTIAAHAIAPIDLVCVNLYPFQQTISKPGVTLTDAIENIDIGGPAMVRSAAKNHHGVAIVVDPADYTTVTEELERSGGDLSLATRKRLAAKAFAHTAAYDGAIATYLESEYGTDEDRATAFPTTLRLSFARAQVLRYGENPHQTAAFYREPGVSEPCVGNARRVDKSNKEVSFNNLFDLNAALELVKEFPDAPAAADHQAHEPVRLRAGRQPGRRLCARARRRHRERVWRHPGRQPAY
jgi:phosphoribosylaminoimidazolecarboxamide formyltransferase/IMP cyclohydrolase